MRAPIDLGVRACFAYADRCCTDNMNEILNVIK